MKNRIIYIFIFCCLVLNMRLFAQEGIEKVRIPDNLNYGYDLCKKIDKDLLQKMADNVELDVVRSRNIGDDRIEEVIKDSDNSIQIVRSSDQQRITWKYLAKQINKPVLSNSLADKDTILYEGFDEAPSYDQTWYPEGWSQFSLAGNVLRPADGGTSLIWRLSQGSISGTIDGQYVMWLNQDMMYNPNAVHDEWLVSKNFIPGEYSLLDFYLFYCPLFMLTDGDAKKMNFKESFKIHVSTDNGESWNTIWNLEDIVRKMSVAEMSTGSGNTIMPVWHNYRVDLSDYANQDIRLAFQVKGKAQSVALDQIVVRNPAPRAAYLMPEGSMRWGYGEDLSFFTTGQFYLAPAYTNLKWQNVSNDETKTYTWSFENTDTLLSNSMFFNDFEPELSYPYCRKKFPELTAYNDIKIFYDEYCYSPLDFSFIQYGGNTKYKFSSTNTDFMFGAGTFDIEKGLGLGLVYEDSDSCFLFGKGSQDIWQAYKLKGLVNIFDKPVVPYTFTKVWVKAYNVSCNYNSKLELAVCEVDENGIPLEENPIATSVCYGSDIKLIYSDGRFNFYNIPFEFMEIDNTGRQKLRTLVIDKSIAVILRGFDSEDFKSIGFAYQGAPHDNNEYHACVYMKPRNQPEEFYPLQNVFSNYNISFIFSMDVNYPFMINEGTDNIEFGQNGGNQSIMINTLEDFEKWTIEGLPDWLSIKELYVDGSFHRINFVADKNDSPLGERSTTVKLSVLGAEPIFLTVKQESSVSSIENDLCDVKITWYKNGNDIIFDNCGDYSYIEVYNLSGSLVLREPTNNCNRYVLSDNVIKPGCNIVKFIGNKVYTVKVIY